MAHLALAYAHVTGRERADLLQERVFAPIGIESEVTLVVGTVPHK
jgi:hypothetical protein